LNGQPFSIQQTFRLTRTVARSRSAETSAIGGLNVVETAAWSVPSVTQVQDQMALTW
jgi:hypothetical protein